ncbi:MAG: hypothetical protein BWX80_04057 [Candidatus Hydrogenedentes bacterium ADurb.Bin101]|nr:MAG: hypothetical protein BWX80_04057 [Candidatus Hydrogenedentes bacterium ADurb.Bin101]
MSKIWIESKNRKWQICFSEQSNGDYTVSVERDRKDIPEAFGFVSAGMVMGLIPIFETIPGVSIYS